MADSTNPLSTSRFVIRRRRFLGTIALGAAGALLAACGQAPQPSPTAAPAAKPAAQPTPGTQPPPAEAKPTAAAAQPAAKAEPAKGGAKTKVRIAGWQSAPVEGEIMLGQAKRFGEEVDTSVEVETLLLPRNQYVEKVLTMMASGTAPDVAQFTPDEFPDYASRGALRSLDPLIKEDKQFDINVYWEPHVKSFQWKGQQGGVPIYNSPYVLFYNKTMFDKAGIKYPDENWTWHKEVIEAGKALTKEGQFGLGFDGWIGRISAKYWGDGAELFNEDYTESRFDKPEAIQAVQEFADLRHVHKIAPTPGQTGDMGNDQLFATGRIAMYITGQWVVNNLVKEAGGKFEFDVMLQPKGRKQRLARLGGGCYSITSDSKQPAVAWKLIKWQAGDEVQRRWARAGLQPPAIKSIGESADYLNVKPPENVKIFVEMTKYSKTLALGLPGYDEWNRMITSSLDPVWLGQKKAADALPDLKKKLDDYLKGIKRGEWKALV